ncbi:hypothetical protein DLM78_22090 [Leptospira stimsonii]|uniref:Uncharacterized protein n=1 Tax=Leptospira stimsonii TaxID=2202203 RepID=A0A8B3CLE0_9LEPT|nr:hypothetical protein DLM78_22090 [Leptospira stimsonii]
MSQMMLFKEFFLSSDSPSSPKHHKPHPNLSDIDQEIYVWLISLLWSNPTHFGSLASLDTAF